MRPTMVCNFVTLAKSAGDNVRMLRDVFADHKKSCLDMVGGEQIKQFWRKCCAWSMIECPCDVRAVDVHRVECDFRFGRALRVVIPTDLRCDLRLRSKIMGRN